MILNCILETGLEATEWKQWEVWVWNRQICETVFLRSGSKDLAMGFTDSREGFRIGSTSSPQVQLWFVFHSKYLASWMLLWLNFSRVAILNPKQSRRICSVVKQHFSHLSHQGNSLVFFLFKVYSFTHSWLLQQTRGEVLVQGQWSQCFEGYAFLKITSRLDVCSQAS